MSPRPASAGAAAALSDVAWEDAPPTEAGARSSLPTETWQSLDMVGTSLLEDAGRSIQTKEPAARQRPLPAAAAGPGAEQPQPQEQAGTGTELPPLDRPSAVENRASAAGDSGAQSPLGSSSVSSVQRQSSSPRVMTPTLLRKTGERADGQRTSSLHGTPPAWVSMGERGQWREDKMEQDRAEQHRLMSSMWSRDFPDEPPERLSEGTRLKIMGQSRGGGPASDATAASHRADATAGSPTSPKSPQHTGDAYMDAGVTLDFTQPMLASGTTKVVVARPLSPANRVPGGMDEPAATAPPAPDVELEPFSPSVARPQTAPDTSFDAAQYISAQRATMESSATASRPRTADYAEFSDRSGGAAAGRNTSELPAAVNAALMQRQTAPPDPKGLDPMVSFQLRPMKTEAADLWMDPGSTAGGDEVIGLIERIGEGRADKREESRRNRERLEWQERADRFAKIVRANAAEVDVAMKRLQHMGGAEAGLLGEAGQAGKARSAEARELRQGREALATAVSCVRRQVTQQPSRSGRRRSSSGGGRSGSAVIQDELTVLRNDITAAEAALVEYKNDQRRGYELLRQSEAGLTRELTFFEETMAGWEQEKMLDDNKENSEHDAALAAKRVAKTTSRSRGRGASPSLIGGSPTEGPEFTSIEVTQFEDYVDEFGPSGGWHSADHSAFLTVWSRYVKTAEAAKATHAGHWAHSTRFLASACAGLPALAEEVVEEHAAWYLEYVRLLDAKRDAIAAWRHRKRLAVERRRIKMEEEAARQEAGAGPKLATGSDPAARAANARKLEEWRIRKNAAKKKENEERQAAEDRVRAKRTLEERREKAKRAAVMQQREERMQEKRRQAELLAERGETASSSRSNSTAVSTIGQLQARDREMGMRRKETLIAKQQTVENARRLSAGTRPRSANDISNNPRERDPERLYKPTMTTLLRYDLGDFDPSTGGERPEGAGEKRVSLGRSTNVSGGPRPQRRATPTWRGNKH